MTLRNPPFASLALSFFLATAFHTAQAAVNDELHALVTSAQQAPASGARPYDERDWLERFYAPRAYAPAWLVNGTAKASAAIAVLRSAPANGLTASDYQVDELEKQLRTATPNDAKLDAAITRAMLHYLAELKVGRLRSEYLAAGPDPRLKTFDPVEQLRTALAENRLAALAASAESQMPQYQHVKAALAHYRELAQFPQTALPLPAKGAKIESGAAYPQAGTLRVLLERLGDDPGAPGAGPDDHYTPALVEAVKRFQARHGLESDGVLGRDTVGALNTPLQQRVRQLELTLERLRWVPDLPAGPVIIVNLPAFHLWAYDTAAKNAQPLEMKVIVGAATKTETPLFIGTMRYLEFNPYWNVPRSIEKAEIIPKMEKNASYLAENDMEMVPTGGGAAIQGGDAAALEGLRAGSYRVRQRPGPKNALGTVKFAMPNPDNIYLHWTSAAELFKRTRRDLSHGCIRVEKPAALAEFVLASNADWDAEKIATAMEPGTSKTVSLKTTIPVVLFYTTATTDAKGKAIFSPDVYLRDAALGALLDKHNGGSARPVPKPVAVAAPKPKSAPKPAPTEPLPNAPLN
ncbi:MAG: murein L,D-transpeptidase [Massilia sp.]